MSKTNTSTWSICSPPRTENSCLLKVSSLQRHLGSNQERKIAFLAFLQLVVLSFLSHFIEELLFSGCVSANAKLLAELTS